MKRIAAVVLVTAMVVAMGSAAFARQGINGFAGRSQIEHLYLFEKDLTDWSVVEDGAYGKAVFNWKHSTVSFEGVGLVPQTEYALVFYSEPEYDGWANRETTVISAGTSDADGLLELGRTAFDIEAIRSMEEPPGAYKIWLVPCSSIVDDQIQWIAPEMFLFESRLLYKP